MLYEVEILEMAHPGIRTRYSKLSAQLREITRVTVSPHVLNLFWCHASVTCWFSRGFRLAELWLTCLRSFSFFRIVPLFSLGRKFSSFFFCANTNHCCVPILSLGKRLARSIRISSVVWWKEICYCCQGHSVFKSKISDQVT